MLTADSDRQKQYNPEDATYSAESKEQPNIFPPEDPSNNPIHLEQAPDSGIKILLSKIYILFLRRKLWVAVFIYFIFALKLVPTDSDVKAENIHPLTNKDDSSSSIAISDTDEPEISHGSVCERHFVKVMELLDKSFKAEIRFAAEKLDEIAPDIEEHCFPSKKGVNLEIYFKMGFVYFRANMFSKCLVWLDKIQNILRYNPGASLDSETIMKTSLILATRYIQQEEYIKAEVELEKAKEVFKDSKKGSPKQAAYLESWLKEVIGELYVAKYLSSTDITGRIYFYEIAQGLYNEAIELRKNLTKFRIAGSAQCMLARLYIEARELDKAEFVNNEGIKNIKRSTEKIYTMAYCIKNDALIKLRREQVDTARVRFQKALDLVEEVLPKGNDLIIHFRKEFSKIFSNKL